MSIPSLTKDDHIAIVVLGSNYPEDIVNEILATIKNNCGMSVHSHESLYKWYSPQAKAEILLDYLRNDDIKLIWSLRGGEGCADLLPYLEKHSSEISKLKPKILLGFSDCTPLLLYLSQKFNWPCIHGAVASQIRSGMLSECSLQATIKLLSGSGDTLLLTELEPLNSAAKQDATIATELTGGNLSLLTLNHGDSWQVDCRNKIIFIEDWHERGYKVERALKYFRRLGWFKDANALILGDFLAGPLSTNEVEQEEQVAYMHHVLQRFAGGLDIPVLQSQQFGHGYVNMPLPLGVKVALDLNSLTLSLI